MDKEFQTTFIPKKPLMEEPQKRARASRPLGIFSAVAIFIFIIAVIASGAVFAYERFLNNRLVTLKGSLELAEKSFEPSLIVALQSLDTRLRVAETLLNGHVAVSPVFRVIEDTTLQSIQYESFEYIFEGGQARVKMSGIARQYQTIAEQSLLFGENRFITNHIFSNFSLTSTGRVSFDLELIVSPELVLFVRSLGEVPTAIPLETLPPSTITETPVETSEDAQSEIGIPSLDPNAASSTGNNVAPVNL